MNKNELMTSIKHSPTDICLEVPRNEYTITGINDP